MMTNFDKRTDVSQKLSSQLQGAKKAGRYAAAVADECVKALEIFASQDEEFAQAILDGNFEECMKDVEKACSGKRSVSDLLVYKTCAKHYFRGADVIFDMRIRVNPYEDVAKAESAKEAEPAKERPVAEYKQISLDDFF